METDVCLNVKRLHGNNFVKISRDVGVGFIDGSTTGKENNVENCLVL